jgi:hypothetical protein
MVMWQGRWMPGQLIGTHLILLEPVAAISGQKLTASGNFFTSGLKTFGQHPIQTQEF